VGLGWESLATLNASLTLSNRNRPGTTLLNAKNASKLVSRLAKNTIYSAIQQSMPLSFAEAVRAIFENNYEPARPLLEGQFTEDTLVNVRCLMCRRLTLGAILGCLQRGLGCGECFQEKRLKRAVPEQKIISDADLDNCWDCRVTPVGRRVVKWKHEDCEGVEEEEEEEEDG